MTTAFWWEKNPVPKLGVTCRSIETVEAFAAMPEFDILEIKPNNMARKGFPLYFFDGTKYQVHQENVEELKKILCGKPYQVHMTYDSDKEVPGEPKLFQIREADHPLIIDRQRVVAEIFACTSNKGICVWHLVCPKVGGKTLGTLEEAYEVVPKLYLALDKLVIKEGWPIQITFENQAAPKTKDEVLGYDPEHIWKLLGQTKRIGVTIDTGHGNLALEDFHFRTFMGSGLPVCSMHFHGNEGRFDPDSYDDDQHEFATPKNIRGYNRWISFFKRMGIPVILELDSKYKPEEIQEYAKGLRKELGI